MIYFLSILILFTVSLFTLYSSFGLALFGDDWLAFFRYFEYVGPKSIYQLNHISYFLTTYGPQDILMGLLQKVYGYQSTYYYLTSYILRVLAAISLYPLTFYLTKNKLSSFFAVIFFSVTTIGVDTTNWVFNMPSYISIIFFNLFLFFFLNILKQADVKKLFLAGLFFYLASVFAPIRMTGLLPFSIILALFFIIQGHLKTTKQIITQILFILLIFLLVIITGKNAGTAPTSAGSFFPVARDHLILLKTDGPHLLLHPFIILGSLFVPSPLLLTNTNTVSKLEITIIAILPFIIFLIIAFIISKNISPLKPYFFIINFSSAIFWTLMTIIFYPLNSSSLSNSTYILFYMIGGYVSILFCSFVFSFWKDNKIIIPFFVAISWIILSFIFAWWWSPTSIYLTEHRYLIVSAVGISLFLASIISLGKTSKNTKSLFIFCSLFLLIQIFSTRSYLAKQNNTHNQQVSSKIWSSMPNIPEMGKDELPLIFYFEGDGTNEGIIQDSVTFGFPPHMALLYNISEENRTPIPMSNWQELISAVKDGKVLPAYGYPTKPIPLERIFAFKLLGKDSLINVTDLAREKLAEEITK